jgi:F0F1-type ATP synthase assembly protein I
VGKKKENKQKKDKTQKKKKNKKKQQNNKKKTHEKQYFSQRVLEYLLIHTIVTLFFWLYIKSF